MAGTTLSSSGVLLNSWKEIANHLGRGVRTVQRWEHELGLPVRRPWGRSRSTVMAMSDELDAWLRTAPTKEINGSKKDEGTAPANSPQPAVLKLRRSIDDALELRARAEQLRREHATTVMRLMGNIAQMEALTRNVKTIREFQPRLRAS